MKKLANFFGGFSAAPIFDPWCRAACMVEVQWACFDEVWSSKAFLITNTMLEEMNA